MKWQREPRGQAAETAAGPAAHTSGRLRALPALSYVNVPFRTLVILPPPRTKVCLAHQTPPASVKIPRMFH